MQPAAVVKSDGASTYAPLTVGSFVHVGSRCSISAIAIGSHVLIGDGATVGNGVDIRSCVIVTSGSVVHNSATLPTHTGETSEQVSGDALNIYKCSPCPIIIEFASLNPRAVWHGNPATCVGKLNPSFESLIDQEMKWAFETAASAADVSVQ
jgi:carbonic anhydrase/acetyltransferase-like protein (isoleucine patch superfamily)